MTIADVWSWGGGWLVFHSPALLVFCENFVRPVGYDQGQNTFTEYTREVHPK